MQLLRGPYSTKNEKCDRINESGEAGVVLTEPQRDVLTETALVGFTGNLGAQKGYLLGNRFGYRWRHIGLLLGYYLDTTWIFMDY